MVAQSELLYTWHVPESSLWLRFYVKLYDADKTKITFCRYFWGSLFAPLVVVLYVVLFPLYKGGQFLSDHYYDARSKWVEESLREKLERQRRYEAWCNNELTDLEFFGPPKPPKVVLPAIGNAIVTVAAKAGDGMASAWQGITWTSKKTAAPVQYAYKEYRFFNFIARWSGIIMLGLIVLDFVGAVVFLIGFGFYKWYTRALVAMEWTGVAVACLIGLVVIVVALAYLLDTYASEIADFLDETVYERVMAPFGRTILTPIGHTFRFAWWWGPAKLGHFFYMGYYVTKTRTCPKIEVVE